MSPQAPEPAGAAGQEPASAPMRDAMDAAAQAAGETEQGLGRLGRPLNRRSPLYTGLAGAVGVAIIYVLVQLIVSVLGADQVHSHVIVRFS